MKKSVRAAADKFGEVCNRIGNGERGTSPLFGWSTYLATFAGVFTLVLPPDTKPEKTAAINDPAAYTQTVQAIDKAAKVTTDIPRIPNYDELNSKGLRNVAPLPAPVVDLGRLEGMVKLQSYLNPALSEQQAYDLTVRFNDAFADKRNTTFLTKDELAFRNECLIKDNNTNIGKRLSSVTRCMEKADEEEKRVVLPIGLASAAGSFAIWIGGAFAMHTSASSYRRRKKTPKN